MSHQAIESKEIERISPFFWVLHVDNSCVRPRPFLFEDELCVVMSHDHPGCYFSVIPRKPITMLPSSNIEPNDVLLREHMVTVAKKLAVQYEIKDDDYALDNCNGFYGSRFCLHFNLNVCKRNLPEDLTGDILELHDSIPATNMEMTEECRVAIEEYELMNSKYKKFVTRTPIEFELGEEWREPEDEEMREIIKMKMLQRMFPYTFLEDRPFSFYMDKFPILTSQVHRLENGLYLLSNSPLVYMKKVDTLIEKERSKVRKLNLFPEYLTSED